jgi:hypothetical protein
MGNPGIGKSTFALYLLARLIASHTLTLFKRAFVLIHWVQAPMESRQIRVGLLRGEATLIHLDDFHASAAAGAFVIVDGLAYNKTSPFLHCLSIVSPSECVDAPSSRLCLYVPPITELQLELLSGVSRRYPLRDVDAMTHGSIESRMKITGGNLRQLFSNRSLAKLEEHFGDASRAINFARAPRKYFARTEEGENEPYHIAFACFPIPPFAKSGSIGYVSDFVKQKLTAAFVNLKKKEEYDAIRKAGTFVHRLLGFSLNNPSVRGLLFEDLCYDRIRSNPPIRYHFELFFKNAPNQRIEIPRIAQLDSGDLTTIPEDSNYAWLWASTNSSNRGFDAIFYSGDTIYVLQITIGVTHPPVDLGLIRSHVSGWIGHRRKCYFVVLTDSRGHLDKILHSVSLLRGVGWWQDLQYCVGLLVSDADGQPVALDFPDSI